VPDLARPLAVAGEAGCGQRVNGRALRAQPEPGLAHVGPPEHRLERSDVEVLAGVARGHDRDLGRRQLELANPARFEQREDPERLDRGTQVDDVVRVAEGPQHPATGVGLDDVAPVDALLDPAAELPNEHRGGGSTGLGGRPGSPRAGGDDGLGGHGVRVLPPMLGCGSMPPAELPANLHVSQHPAVLHKLGILRDEKTEPKKFREVVRELSWLLGYEALADAKVRSRKVTTPLETMDGHELGERIGLIPILRAGLGMVDAMLELMPTATSPSAWTPSWWNEPV